MDAVVVGILAALTATVGMLYYTLQVRPEVLLSLFSDSATTDAWLDEHPAALSALRWSVGVGLFLIGFLTGLATAFLSRTAA